MSEALAVMPGYYPAIYPSSEDILSSFVDYCSVKDSTLKGYIVCLKAFARWAQENGIKQPTRADIREYVRFLDSSDLKPGTKTQYLRAVKQMFEWASAEGLCTTNPTQGIKGTWKTDRQHHKKDALGQENVEAIAATIDQETEQGKRLYAMLLLCIVDGLRTVEISRANLEDIKTIGGKPYLYVWGKGHSEPDTPVFLTQEVQEALQAYISSRTDNPTGKSPLFVSTSNRSKGKRISTTTISTILKDMLKGAGYDSDRLTAHSLRHTSGTGAHKIGMELYDIQHLMRHAGPETTEIYIHDDENIENEERGRNMIYQYFFGQETQRNPREEALALVQMMPAEKLEKALAVLRAIQ